jgi:hypothetical protein
MDGYKFLFGADNNKAILVFLIDIPYYENYTKISRPDFPDYDPAAGCKRLVPENSFCKYTYR